MDQSKKLSVAFYRLPGGAEPVRDWIKSLSVEDRQVLGRDLRLVEMGWPIGMQLCRSLGKGLWELRSSLPGKQIARIFFSAGQGFMILLHGFLKKTQKTPQSDLELARTRQREVAG